MIHKTGLEGVWNQFKWSDRISKFGTVYSRPLFPYWLYIDCTVFIVVYKQNVLIAARSLDACNRFKTMFTD